MKTPNLDTDKPALVPEITQDPATARKLCERARRCLDDISHLKD